MNILVTGVAGFIGMSTALRLLKFNDYHVVGVDNLNSYYDINLKKSRLNRLKNYKNFSFHEFDIQNEEFLEKIFNANNFSVVLHLAAQAGVRYSLSNPKSYIDSNINAFLNVLEKCRKYKIKNFIFASSSSVYGLNKSVPFDEDNVTDHPVSLYGATKKSNEVIAHSYSHLYKIPTTGLRFFTVYGPWGRPDMSPFIFAKSLIEASSIKLFNNGRMQRDYTYIDDITLAIQMLIKKPATPDNFFDASNPSTSLSSAPFRIFNIGNSKPVKIRDFLSELEKNFDKKAKIELYPMQPGDVKITSANTEKLNRWIDFKPKTSLSFGVSEFCKWYKTYFKIY